MISFTIGGVSYQAEEGMTWQEWVASGYNTGGYYVNSGGIYTSTAGLITDPIDTNVSPDTQIVADRAYTVVN